MRGALPTQTRSDSCAADHRRPHLRFERDEDTTAAVRECVNLAAPNLEPGRLSLADDDQNLQRIWREFKATRSPALRDYLIIHYMSGHVRRIAQRLHARLPRQVDVDDLVDEAYEALTVLIDQYDINRVPRTQFETYSSQRLDGAMRDYLRAIDPAPRLVRHRAKKVQEAMESFQKLHGHVPSPEELRKHMGLSARIFEKFMGDARPAMMLSFNSALRGHGGRCGRATGNGGGGAGRGVDRDAMAGFEDHKLPSPLSRAVHGDLRRWISEGFAKRDRLIIMLYYYEQMTMREIGMTLGCSESRVSQRLKSIVKCLRARLKRSGGKMQLLNK